MLPHGTRIFNRLGDFIRSEYRRRGYDEVVTPLMFKKVCQLGRSKPPFIFSQPLIP